MSLAPPPSLEPISSEGQQVRKLSFQGWYNSPAKDDTIQHSSHSTNISPLQSLRLHPGWNIQFSSVKFFSVKFCSNNKQCYRKLTLFRNIVIFCVNILGQIKENGWKEGDQALIQQKPWQLRLLLPVKRLTPRQLQTVFTVVYINRKLK